MIKFKDVCKIYDNNTVALENFNMNIDEGEFVFVVGASGAGKSTFLKLIMREEVATSGQVLVNDVDPAKLSRKKIPLFRRSMGVVFQDFRLIEKMNVFNNVAFAMRVIGASEIDVRKRVPYILGLVGLRDKVDRFPSQLSGGEQQRVSLARALVNNPKLIIADEPTGNVDPSMSLEILALLDEINKQGTTIVMVTHEHDLVEKFNHRIIEIGNKTILSDKPMVQTV